MSAKKALIAGATGLVGQELLEFMKDDSYFESVTVLSRRDIPGLDAKFEVHIVDFDHLNDHKALFNVHHVFCCLGTTMKQAGSKEAFRKIDQEYPRQMAELALSQPRFECFHVVTAMGANPKSPLFYNEVKGHLEEDLVKMELPSLNIYRPTLLFGQRTQVRFGEEVAKILTTILSFFIIGSSRARLWSIQSREVAAAMMYAAKNATTGLKIYRPKHIKLMSNR
jgi:uncharacterized protein YbjT (DUF2867 family)